jgi:ParB family chromosome partitioning protein
MTQKAKMLERIKQSSGPLNQLSDPTIKDHIFSTSDGKVALIDMESIAPGPWQARMSFDDEELTRLANTFDQFGPTVPVILARNANDGFLLVDGERRWRANKLRGNDQIRAIVKGDVGELSMQKIALLLNLHRKDFHPIEFGLKIVEIIDNKVYSDTNEAVAALNMSQQMIRRYIHAASLESEAARFAISEKYQDLIVLERLSALPPKSHCSIIKEIITKKVGREEALELIRTHKVIRDDRGRKPCLIHKRGEIYYLPNKIELASLPDKKRQKVESLLMELASALDG